MNGARIEIHTDGSILTYTNADVKKIVSIDDASRRRRSNDVTTEPSGTDVEAEPPIGVKIADGSIYAGISPDTNKPLYAMPADAPLTYNFNGAQEYAQRQNAAKLKCHDDWRVPTKNELNLLFNNRAKIGGFNVRGCSIASWYWSSSQYDGWDAWGQRFSVGSQYYYGKHSGSSVRLVLTGP